MSNELFVAEILYIITTFIAAYVAYEFYQSKNGILRKILVFHFLSQAWAGIVNGVFFYFYERGFELVLSVGATRLIALTPLAISMILILEYIKKKNKPLL